VKPNIVHEILGQWQIEGKLGAVMTQNYDSANDKAGISYYYSMRNEFVLTPLSAGEVD
jgi:NAD-dependent SIR2 family protein deacetylase